MGLNWQLQVADSIRRGPGHGVAVLLKIYAHCIDGRLTPRTSGSPTPSVPRMPRPSRNPVTRETTTSSRHPEMPGQRHKAGRTVGVTAPTAPVRGFFHPRPWTKPGAHGRIADGVRAARTVGVTVGGTP